MYSYLLLTGKLDSYLADLNEQAQERYELVEAKMRSAESVTEELKVRDLPPAVCRCMKLRKQIANRLQLAIKQDIMKKKEEAISMARTANVFARVEPEVKEQAEQVLERLGIPMSNAVGMFLRQIVLQRGIPFEMKLPAYEEPVAYGSLTKEQFNAEIEKGMEDIKAGRVYSADEVEAEMKREFGI